MSRAVLIFWLLFAIASFLCFWGSHKVPLFDTDEPRYAQAAREMMERRDWVLPTFNGQPRYAKPALFYWLLIGAYKVFGVNEFAARFWSGVAAIAIALILFLAIKSSFGWETGAIASLFWFTSLGAMIFAHAAITDMVLTAFMTGAILSFWLGAQKWHPFWFFLASSLCALAVITKGPVGVVLPIAVFLTTLFSIRPSLPQIPFMRLALIALICVALFLAIALPWYVAVSVKTQGEFLKQFLFVENVQRYTQSGKLPLWMHVVYFPLVAFGLGFPWSSIGIWALVKIPELTENQKRWHTLLRIWTILPVLIFTFSQTKNPQYVLLSIPALTTLAAIWLASSSPINERLAHFSWSVTVLMAASLLFLTQPLLNSIPDWRIRLAGYEPVIFGWSIFAMGLLVLVMVTFIALPKRLFSVLAVTAMLGVHALAFETFIPRLGHYRQEPLKHFAQMAASQLSSKDLLAVCCRDLSSVVFYSNRRVLKVNDLKQLKELMRRNYRVDVFMHVKSFPNLKRLSGWHLVERRGAFVWVSNRKVHCPLHGILKKKNGKIKAL
ncbi:MAG: glycosyltransferase family 39 protein [Armatimonadetes bacterium]|nr:glycosyltransferase family 39 protein [Armatimonadota bacterium]MDW8027129.1 glycosyltransferase family 39 protein [Armatimonadota bacterium]